MERLLEAHSLLPPGPRYDQATIAMFIPVVARISGELEHLRTAEAAADVVLSAASATPLVYRTTRWGLALMAVLRGDVQSAREQYSELGLAPVNTAFISGDRVLGLLSHTIGNYDQAAAHFEDSLTFCRKAGFGPEVAWTCCDYADTVLQRNNENDRAKANVLLEESLAISTELGMRPLMERVQSRR